MKVTARKSTLILSALLFQSALLAPQFNGCLEASRNSCDVCFQRKFLPGGKFCGPRQPASDPCEIYRPSKSNSNKSICAQCKPGYYIKRQVLQNPTCKKATVANCAIGDSIYVIERCLACENGLYPVIHRVGQKTLTKCQNVSHPDPHCVWGGSFSNSGTAHCARCSEGYAVDFATQTCQRAVRGCLVTENGKCVNANGYDGYSINGNGQVFKTK